MIWPAKQHPEGTEPCRSTTAGTRKSSPPSKPLFPAILAYCGAVDIIEGCCHEDRQDDDKKFTDFVFPHGKGYVFGTAGRADEFRFVIEPQDVGGPWQVFFEDHYLYAAAKNPVVVGHETGEVFVGKIAFDPFILQPAFDHMGFEGIFAGSKADDVHELGFGSLLQC